MKKIILAFCIMVSLGSPLFAIAATTPAQPPVIQELQQLLVTHPEFKQKIDHTLARTRDPLWMGTTSADFVSMFAKWLTFEQTLDSVARYFFLFQGFLDSPGGRTIIDDPLFAPWLHQFMQARGEFLDSPASKPMIANWINHPAIHIDDYIVPKEGFASFNEFFARQIKPGKRPFVKNTLASPVDGVAYILQQDLKLDGTMTVKNDRLNLTEMLDDAELAKTFAHGTASLIFLGAASYHHFHAPVSGKLIDQRLLAGTYYGQLVPTHELLRHRRAVMVIDSPNFGKVAVIPFGMYSISSIVLNKKLGQTLEQGDDLGNFQYGGSTVIVLTEANQADFSLYIADEINTVVQAGSPLANQPKS